MDATYWAYYSNTQPASFVPYEAGSDYSSSNYAGYEDAAGLTWWDLPNSTGYVAPGTPTVGLNQGLLGLKPGDPSLFSTVASHGRGNISRPSSPHGGGFNITFCDGHTMYMSQDVLYQVYAELMTPRAGRLPGSRALPRSTPARIRPHNCSSGRWPRSPTPHCTRKTASAGIPRQQPGRRGAISFPAGAAPERTASGSSRTRPSSRPRRFARGG